MAGRAINKLRAGAAAFEERVDPPLFTFGRAGAWLVDAVRLRDARVPGLA
jgi:hypothetical protein